MVSSLSSPASAIHPAGFARRILLAVCGLTPQIVTETLYALAANGNAADVRFVPTEVHLITTAEGALRQYDWTRYSSRQQQEMTLGGVLGRWTLRGDPDSLAAVWPWLWLGQWLHMGKNATMGLGGYRLEAGA